MQTILKSQSLTRFIRNSCAPLTLAATLFLSAPVVAQGLFSPAITVNDDVITNYQLEQRILLLELLRAPGNPVEGAARELVNDQLRLAAVEEAGIEVTEEGIDAAIEEFAGRANLPKDQFLTALANGGVSRETFRDFVKVGIGWREFVANRFLARARPTEEEIDRALGQSGGTSVQLNIAELIMPVTNQNLQQVEEIALQVQELTSIDAFSAAARQYSAAQTRNRGGSLGWMPLDRLPPALRPVLMSLKTGEVTSPVNLQNAVALFQMRGIREVEAPTARFAAIEFATYLIPGGHSEQAMVTAREVAASVDTCDDLYGQAKGQPEDVLKRQSLPPGEIPQDIAIELAKLDANEISTTVTRNDGQTLLLLMLCGRTSELRQDATREEIAQGLAQQRLTAFANSYLEQLRAEAVITEK